MNCSKVAVFGAGFVGIPTASVLALKNPSVEFTVYDINIQRIQKCKKGEPPIFEPGLQEILKIVIKSNLKFTTKINEALEQAQVVFLALPTPTKNYGEQKGKAYNLSYTQTGIRSIVDYYNNNEMKQNVIIVEKSTVPINTSKNIKLLIKAISIPQNKDKYIIASNPEFLAEGTAINDLMKPDRVILGNGQKKQLMKLSSLFKYVGQQKLIFTTNPSAELSKLVANCFLAQRVSSINSIAILCEQYDADVQEVKKCIASDTRIGDKFLNSSVGFGGSCFKKDILALVYLAESKGLTEVAEYWNQIIKLNEFRKKNFFIKIYDAMNHNIHQKIICIFGTAFKKDTNDPRETPAVQICFYLLLEGAILHLHDPKTSLESFIEEIKLHQLWKQQFQSKLIYFQDAEKAVEGSSAIAVITEWDIFKTYDYGQFYKKMEKPSHIFDGRCLLEDKHVQEYGFYYHRIGKKFIVPQ